MEFFSQFGLRNFYVEYNGADGASYHRAFQTVGANIDDASILEDVKREYKKDGYEVYLLVELLGECTLQEIERIFREADAKGKVIKIIYMDSKHVLL